MFSRQVKTKAGKQDNMVSTENILFILGGSFERSNDDLESIVKKRLQHKGRVKEDGSVEMKLFDIDIEFSKKSVEYVAEISETRKTGARALVSVWVNILNEFQYELPGSNFSNRCVCLKLYADKGAL